MIHLQHLARAGLLLAISVAATVGAPASSKAETVPPHVPGRILVQFKPTTTAQQVRSLVAAAHARDWGEIPHTGVHVLSLPAGTSEVDVGRAIAQRKEVAFVNVDHIYQPLTMVFAAG